MPSKPSLPGEAHEQGSQPSVASLGLPHDDAAGRAESWSPEPQCLTAKRHPFLDVKKNFWRKSFRALAASPLAIYIFINTCLPLEENDGY